jgi:hypothetical protein
MIVIFWSSYSVPRSSQLSSMRHPFGCQKTWRHVCCLRTCSADLRKESPACPAFRIKSALMRQSYTVCSSVVSSATCCSFTRVSMVGLYLHQCWGCRFSIPSRVMTVDLYARVRNRLCLPSTSAAGLLCCGALCHPPQERRIANRV